MEHVYNDGNTMTAGCMTGQAVRRLSWSRSRGRPASYTETGPRSVMASKPSPWTIAAALRPVPRTDRHAFCSEVGTQQHGLFLPTYFTSKKDIIVYAVPRESQLFCCLSGSVTLPHAFDASPSSHQSQDEASSRAEDAMACDRATVRRGRGMFPGE
ncbi:hypothetical protein LIA77_04026 [Sarocladium implicatum]|nr:hypothetical protein LIA77_04026 [Sarocladium implicatum]